MWSPVLCNPCRLADGEGPLAVVVERVRLGLKNFTSRGFRAVARGGCPQAGRSRRRSYPGLPVEYRARLGPTAQNQSKKRLHPGHRRSKRKAFLLQLGKRFLQGHYYTPSLRRGDRAVQIRSNHTIFAFMVTATGNEPPDRPETAPCLPLFQLTQPRSLPARDGGPGYAQRRRGESTTREA